MSEFEWILTCECELILSDAADCCSSGFSVQTSVNPYLSLKPLVEVLSRGEKEPNQVKKHEAWHRVVEYGGIRFCLP